jgi:sigma-B regulation protein RsbU (phosphoserine phosphatase)
MFEKVRNILNNKISDAVLISIVVLMFLFKIIIDLLLLLFSDYDTNLAIFIRIVLSLSVVIPLCIYFFRNFFQKLNNTDEIGFKSFYKEIKNINFMFLLIIFGKILIPNSMAYHGRVSNVIAFVFINIFALLCTIAGLKLIHFLNKWLWVKRHKKTKFQLRLFRISLYFFLIAELPLLFWETSVTDINSNLIFSVPIAILQVILFIVMLFSVSKNTWIALLNKKEKFLLILQSIIIILLSIVIVTYVWENKGDGKFYYSLLLFFTSGTLITWPIFLGIAYFVRILLSAIVSLPTTEIVGRKSNELNLLTYLNKIVSQSIDFNKLLNSATSIAFESINGSGAWTEIYNIDGSVTIMAEQNINKVYLENLHKNNEFSDIFKNIDDYLLVESIEDIRKDNKSYSLINFAKAFIAIPIKDGEKRIGTLVVTCIDEYGFDSEDLNIIQAIGNNVNIALENSKLLSESIEKERYKKELLIARSITQKLIPQDICCIDNYDVSAFLIPAEEVGGDYYDLVTLNDGKPCILIGDISGKGMSAAFYMALLKGVVLCSSKQSSDPKELLVRINNALFQNMDKQMYLTLSAIKIDDYDGNISFARAGHLPLLIKNNNDIKKHTPKGIGIGLVNSKFFESNLELINIKLDPDDYCLLFTDGISESLDSEKNETDYKNLKHILTNSVYNSTGELVKIMEDILINSKKFKDQRDDMTLLALRYNKLGDL